MTRLSLLSGLLVLLLAAPVGAVELTLQTNDYAGRLDAIGTLRTHEDNLPPHIVSGNAIVFRGSPDSPAPLAIWDEPGGTGAGYSRLWLDLDGDRTCATNEFMDLDTHDGRYAEIPPFARLVNDGGHAHSIWVSGYVLSGRDGSGSYMGMRTECTFSGSLDVGGRAVPVSVSDGDGDGLVIEFATTDFQNPGARFVFARGSNSDDRVWMPLSERMGFLGGFYVVNLAFAGDATNPVLNLSIAPIDLPMGTLRVEGADVSTLDLFGDGGSIILELENGCGRVPAGRWRLLEVAVDSGSGSYVASPRHGEERWLDIVAGETAALNVGGPLKHGLDIEGGMLSGRLLISILPSTGIGGLEYTARPLQGSHAPGWLVRRPGGETVASGSFEYG